MHPVKLEKLNEKYLNATNAKKIREVKIRKVKEGHALSYKKS
jgi:hypothetical protein